MLPRRISLLAKRFYNNHIVNSPYKEVTIPNTTVDQYTWENISKWEDKTALECGQTGRRITYKEFRNKSKSLASNLASLGLSGGTVLFVLPNCPDFATALLGSLEAGMTVSGANPVYTAGELKHQAQDSGAKIVITAPDFLETVRSADLGIPIISTGDVQIDGIHSFKEMTERSSNKNTPTAEERLKQLALLPYSSGTTGLPKGVRLKHSNLIANLTQITTPEVCPIHEAIGDYQDTLPAILPFFHIYGSVVLLLRGLRLGAKIVTLPKFDPPTFLKIINENQNIVLHAVPPIINFLGCRPEVKQEHLKGLRYTLTGAAPCSSEDLERLCSKKNHAICQAYGMTESSPVLTHPKLTCANKATIGPPVANTVGRILDPNDGKPVPTGLHGELCFKGPQVMEGYHNRPEATADTVDGEGWLHTGDIGYSDKEGNFYIVDRLKELIKVKGFQVAPAELEALLRQHPTVMDVGVTAAPSVKHGELPVAFLVPKPGQKIDQTAVSQWVEKQVAPYKKLAKIVTVQEIPKSASGKILRRKLKDIAKEIQIE